MFLMLLSACSPPPPAPEGLDEAVRYMVREFYADDATFEAGFQGFMNWFNEEGVNLVGQQATSSNTDTFTLSDLAASDVSQLPLDDNGRDLSNAKGVISLADMACTCEETEAYLVRPDQDAIFSEDWEGYQRTYLSDRNVFESAASNEDFTPIDAPLEPFEDSFDYDAWGRTLLRTVNVVDPKPVVFADLPAYDMNLDIRHGRFEIGGESARLMSILTWSPQEVWNEGGDYSLKQSYSVELNIEQKGGRTLRVLAVWAEPSSPLLASDSPLVLNYGVNKSLAASQRMSDICAGEIDLE